MGWPDVLHGVWPFAAYLLSFCYTPFGRGEKNGKKKRKDYSFISSVWKFKYEGKWGNGKVIHLFGSLSEGNEMEHSFLPILSKPQIFIPQIYIKRMSSKNDWLLKVFSCSTSSILVFFNLIYSLKSSL